jgi:hypothetical protein
VTPKAVARLSSTAAVGLLPPRSISEMFERLTLLRSASASSERPRALRSSRTEYAALATSFMPSAFAAAESSDTGNTSDECVYSGSA